MSNRQRKNVKRIIVVPDTNVIMDDWRRIFDLSEERKNVKKDIVIALTVIEELNYNKDGSAKKCYNSRRFSDFLIKLGMKRLYNGGARIGRENGKISIKSYDWLHEDIRRKFVYTNQGDIRILNVAYNLMLEHLHDDVEVVFVSYDKNVGLKSGALGFFNELSDSNVSGAKRKRKDSPKLRMIKIPKPQNSSVQNESIEDFCYTASRRAVTAGQTETQNGKFPVSARFLSSFENANGCKWSSSQYCIM